MMDNNQALPTGEARLRNRRNRLLRFITIGMLIALVTGFMVGFTANGVAERQVPPFAIYGFLLLVLVGFTWASYGYFKRVDELDVADNLWASLIGLYFYMCAFPSWWMLHEIGLVIAPNQWAIYVATLSFSLAVYGIRKLGWR